MEIWKSVIGYENLYEVSNLGNVRRLWQKSKKNRSLKIRKDGYIEVDLWKNGKSKFIRIHILVAQSFIENINNLKYINHIDGDKSNNKVENLEWCTQSHNRLHATKILKVNTKQYKWYLYKEDTLIKEFEDCFELANYLNKDFSHITKLCRTNKFTKDNFQIKRIKLKTLND